MSANKVEFSWTNEFQGTLETTTGVLNLGTEQGEFKPYQLLFGSLGGCFYSTFLGIVKRRGWSLAAPEWRSPAEREKRFRQLWNMY